MLQWPGERQARTRTLLEGGTEVRVEKYGSGDFGVNVFERSPPGER